LKLFRVCDFNTNSQYERASRRVSTVGVLTSLNAGCRRTEIRFSARARDYSLLWCSCWLWSSQYFNPKRTGVFLPGL